MHIFLRVLPYVLALCLRVAAALRVSLDGNTYLYEFLGDFI